MPTIKEIVDSYMERLRESILAEYQQDGLRASGRFAEELDYIYEETETNVNVQLVSPEYTQYLIEGRQPGPVPVQVIRDWIRDKGIQPSDGTPEQLAWAITTVITRDGISVPNPNNQGELLDPLQEFVDNEMPEQLADEVGVNKMEESIDRMLGIIDNSNFAKKYKV